MDCLSDCETMKTNSSNLGKRNYQLTLPRRKIALVQQQLVWKWYESDLVASIRILVRWRYRPLIGKINCQSIHGTKWERLWRAFPSLVLKIEQWTTQTARMGHRLDVHLCWVVVDMPPGHLPPPFLWHLPPLFLWHLPPPIFVYLPPRQLPPLKFYFNFSFV